MPAITLTLGQARPAEQIHELVERLHQEMQPILQIPAHDRFYRVLTLDQNHFFLPPERKQNFLFAEFLLFPGRSAEVKTQVFRAVVRVAEQFGIDAQDTRTIILDVPMENWGLRGGRSGLELYGPAAPRLEVTSANA